MLKDRKTEGERHPLGSRHFERWSTDVSGLNKSFSCGLGFAEFWQSEIRFIRIGLSRARRSVSSGVCPRALSLRRNVCHHHAVVHTRLLWRSSKLWCTCICYDANARDVGTATTLLICCVALFTWRAVTSPPPCRTCTSYSSARSESNAEVWKVSCRQFENLREFTTSHCCNIVYL